MLMLLHSTSFGGRERPARPRARGCPHYS